MNFVIGGATQMLLVAGPIAVILIWLGMTPQSSLLIASAVAFSSMVLVFWSLSEIRQAQQTHDR